MPGDREEFTEKNIPIWAINYQVYGIKFINLVSYVFF
ncbi:Uncharacterised protein [Serratia grimesii]|nr:Uncharacterised protein [Serratia grimesii]